MHRLSGLLNDFAVAWRLLTVIPLPFVPENFDRPAGRAAAFYPLVGLILGGLLAGVGQLLYFLWPPGLAAALLLSLWAGLTGLLHLDGFMDSCDGLLPPREPARRLEIMKDSRAGAFGVVGVILLLLLKFNGLRALTGSYQVLALVTIPTLARWAMMWQMAQYPLARSEGLALFFQTGLGRPQLIGASVVTIAIALMLMGWSGVGLLVLTWLTTVLLARFALARISGLTGDVYGATCEVVETVLLIAVVVLRNF